MFEHRHSGGGGRRRYRGRGGGRSRQQGRNRVRQGRLIQDILGCLLYDKCSGTVDTNAVWVDRKHILQLKRFY